MSFNAIRQKRSCIARNLSAGIGHELGKEYENLVKTRVNSPAVGDRISYPCTRIPAGIKGHTQITFIDNIYKATLAQLVEHEICNFDVGGSNPPGGSTLTKCRIQHNVSTAEGNLKPLNREAHTKVVVKTIQTE